jgi:hypothetical protein
MTDSDKLLESLVKRVNESGELLDITVTVGGALLTGQLAPRAAWLSTTAEQLEETSAAAFAADFRAEGRAMDTAEYLHLSGGKVLAGVTPVPTNGGLMRLPLARVDNWMIGRIGC